MRPNLVKELRWKRGDTVVCVVVDGDLIVRKLRADELADAMRGAIYRRRELIENTPNAGSWSSTRTKKVSDAGS